MGSFKFFLSGILFVSLLLPLSVAAGPSIASISIENGTRTPIEQIQKVIPLKEGDPFDPTRLGVAVSYLKKWGRFRSVEVEKSTSKEGVHLRFLLKEGFLVSGIDLYGGYPFLSARLRRMLTVHSGDLYDPELATQQEEKLEAFYQRKGYSETEVKLTPRFNEKKGTVDLVYQIRRGMRYHLGPITVIGNTVFPYGYFVSQLNPLRAYEAGRFREALEKIRKNYQEKGYLKARIRLKGLGEDPESRKINPVLELSEGKQVTVSFEGNARVSRRTFKQIIPLYTERGYGRYEIEASAAAIRNHYRLLGFHETTVTTEQKDLSEEKIFVRFVIVEGPQTRVKKILIDGNKELSDRKIKKELTTEENLPFSPSAYQPRTVEQDFKDLPRILQDKGALEGVALDHKTVLNSFRDRATVHFSIEEGEMTRIQEIQFIGNHHLSPSRLKKRLRLKEGSPLSPELVEREREQIAFTYSNHGFPYATVTHEVLRDGTAARVIYRIDEGIEVRIGEVLVVGNERTLQSAVEKSILLKRGKPFSYEKLIESERALRKTGSFKSAHVETIGLAEKEPVIHLLVKLEEYRKIQLDFGATYDTDNQFTGNLTLSHVNLFGTARRANLKLTGGRDIQSGEAILKDPHFLGYNFEAILSGLVEREARPAFKTIDAGGALSFLRELTPRITFLGRYELTRTFFTDVTDTTGQDEEDHTTSKFAFSTHYDKRDSFADPRRGYALFGGFDVSNKLIASTFNFIQPKGYFAYYLPLGGRVTLLNFFRIEGIKVFGGDRLTRDERLFLGGDYSIRGFDEDKVGAININAIPTGGQLLLAQTTELQIKLFKEFKLALFADHGSISGNFSDVSPTTFRHSAGLGLRYATPVGPLRLDYGIKLDRTFQFQKRGDGTIVFAREPFGRLHFAFGYAF